MNLQLLLKTKTFWTAIIAVLTTVGGYVQGAVTVKEAAFAILTTLYAVFIRDSIASK